MRFLVLPILNMLNDQIPPCDALRFQGIVKYSILLGGLHKSLILLALSLWWLKMRLHLSAS
jgi:hypothetical protein